MPVGDPKPNPEAAKEAVKQGLIEIGMEAESPIFQVLLDFPDEANKVIAEQKQAIVEWGKHGQNVKGRIEIRLPDQHGQPRGDLLLTTMEYITPLFELMETVNSLRGDRSPEDSIRTSGLIYLVPAVGGSEEMIKEKMINRLAEVMKVNEGGCCFA